MLEVEERNVEALVIPAERAPWPDFDLRLLDAPLKHPVLLVPGPVDARIVRQLLLPWIDTLADVDGIDDPRQVFHEVVEEEESRPALQIQLEGSDVQAAIVEELVRQLVELDRQFKPIEDSRHRVNSEQVRVSCWVQDAAKHLTIHRDFPELHDRLQEGASVPSEVVCRVVLD